MSLLLLPVDATGSEPWPGYLCRKSCCVSQREFVIDTDSAMPESIGLERSSDVDDVAPWSTAGRGWWLVLGVRAVVVLLAVAAVVLGARNAVHASEAGLRLARHRPVHDPGQHTVDQINWLRRQLAAQVPAGAWITVGQIPPEYVGWHQRIVEVATLEHVRVAVDPASAKYRVSLYLDPASRDGSGLRLAAVSLR